MTLVGHVYCHSNRVQRHRSVQFSWETIMNNSYLVMKSKHVIFYLRQCLTAIFTAGNVMLFCGGGSYQDCHIEELVEHIQRCLDSVYHKSYGGAVKIICIFV